ncbi:MAG: hypothetical protein JW885_02825 [Deltaproteobacteria bacterium]|nr:hypothetical protein [Candidatus Zymogenaceae bacterium]
MAGELGGALEIIRCFHGLWYGRDCTPVLTARWALVLGYYRKMQKKPEISEKGFCVDHAMIREDGKIMYEEVSDVFGDPDIPKIIARLFGYE